MRVFVGIGQGLGNAIMALPLVDSIHAEGHDVVLDIRPTPKSIERELFDILATGRRWLKTTIGWGDVFSHATFDAAALCYWHVQMGGPLPKARDLYVGNPPSDEPEIESNLAAAPFLKNPTKRAVLHFPREFTKGHPHYVVIHPGCKDDPEWKRRKVYPRWAEVTHRLKDRGAYVAIVGTASDDAYCGEPHSDHRGQTKSLTDLARYLASCDCLVSGDSGLHHMAVALGVPTVAIFGESSVGKAKHPDAARLPIIRTFAHDPREIAMLALERAEAGQTDPLTDDGHEPDPVT